MTQLISAVVCKALTKRRAWHLLRSLVPLRPKLLPSLWAPLAILNVGGLTMKPSKWETRFLPLLVLTRRGRSTAKNQSGNNFLSNTRDFPEIIASTGAKVWQRFCLSVLVLVIFKSPRNGD